ncbi:Pre-mRNA-splicing factor slt11 [Coccidioides posadasii str. Silveira]|uniref:Pre-mRNA-splicing factor SLT11 n=3 Tax=Coccidioides posadasii TaxID=199306 RepID=E9DEM2_COCPS|nr:RNA recognition motif containing protein [Coccidioides posadasii C735 delta SOWgp]EER28242.1 RNA recognition motif containing protein [Coccidioides posadasii C735 delta SOWgp]EFW15084.1 pre-mRNA-splicing factor slt11 [Coccidioides posadasii str. Silveira]KMM68854.1 pre-mRNA-splicing factor slt11 [Coccidioides posadasii RMSCC 3488]QVM09901.1 Pre-mRNA-splicing factor slt11 [Coccidioides posadasii str. Silveira]|eukprot:XP_003070387.1 RNA recognition motif containing protein [Coccidioides posadasii C735 delta SOWgp]
MPPQIKQDINRSGWETTDFPSVCEQCLPDNPYVQMLKEDYAAECKICTRPMTVFRWKADRTARTKATNICLTCARLKNCCQCCMLDLSFGLPIVVRDAALKMVAPGPQSSINREYYAQEHEKELEEGRGAVEEYEKTDEKARELLRRLARSEPYYKRQRRLEASGATEGGQTGQKQIGYGSGPGPIRTSDTRQGGHPPGRGRGNAGRGRGGRVFPSAAQLPPGPQDILPPADPNITSLFLSGVEDDLPEHAIRSFFTPFGIIRSLICSHRSHCAFVNYATREAAEAAAAHCQGKAVIQGCPLRVKWGKPRPLDSMEREERMQYAREGRQTAAAAKAAGGGQRAVEGAPVSGDLHDAAGSGDRPTYAVAPPPGKEEVQYASMAGD